MKICPFLVVLISNLNHSYTFIIIIIDYRKILQNLQSSFKTAAGGRYNKFTLHSGGRNWQTIIML